MTLEHYIQELLKRKAYINSGYFARDRLGSIALARDCAVGLADMEWPSLDHFIGAQGVMYDRLKAAGVKLHITRDEWILEGLWRIADSGKPFRRNIATLR